MPTISVIIPAYNAEKTITFAIQSVINQDFEDWELIIIDDGSTDQTYTICREFISCNKIRLIHQENAGRSAARNEGIANSSGYWITFLDADDTLFPDSLSTLLSATTEDTGIVCGGYTTQFQKTPTPSKQYIYRGIDFANLVLNPCTQPSIAADDNYFDSLFERTIWGKLYKGELIRGCNISFLPNLRFGEDALFNIYAGLCAREIRTINHISYYYNRENEGTTRHYNSENVNYVIDFANKSFEFLSFLKSNYPIHEKDIYYFIADEFMRLLHRTANNLVDLKTATKDLNNCYASPIVKESLKYYDRPSKAGAAVKKLYIFLIQHQHTAMAIIIERIIYYITKNVIQRN